MCGGVVVRRWWGDVGLARLAQRPETLKVGP